MTPVAPSGGDEIVVWNGTLAPGASGSSVTDTVQVCSSLLLPSRRATRSFGTGFGLFEILATWPLIASVGVPFRRRATAPPGAAQAPGRAPPAPARPSCRGES